MGDAALNADLPREPIVQRKSRVQKIFKNSDYTVPDYTPGQESTIQNRLDRAKTCENRTKTF